MEKYLTPLVKKIINFAGYFITWIVGAVTASHGFVWPGFIVGMIFLIIHLKLCESIKHEIKYIVIVTLMGISIESWLYQQHYLSFAGANPWYPFSPPWMWGIWLTFSSTLNSSLAIFQRHRYVAASCGAVDLPLSYIIGHNVGAIVLIQVWKMLFVLSMSWMFLLPLAAWLAMPKTK